jgi:hypothetical protein
MDAIFEPWELILFNRLAAADDIAAKIYREAGMFSIPSNFRKEYMQAKIIDMIDQIAEQREDKQAGPK